MSATRTAVTAAAAAAAVLAFALPAAAVPIAFDNFESYSNNGVLNGQNGGTGWTGAWTAIPGVNTRQDETGVSSIAGEITGDTESITAATRTFAPQTGTVYFSLRLSAVAGLDVDDFLHIYLSNSAASNNNSGGVGLLSTTTDFLGARVGGANGGDTNSSTTAAVQGQTYTLVGKLSKVASANYNRIDLFVNPASTTEPGTASASDTGDSTVSTVSVFGVRSFNFDAGDRYQFDDVRIGTTFADVVVPEPGSAAALLLAGTATLARRRRNR